MKVELTDFRSKLKKVIEGQHFEVGVLEDKEHHEALPAKDGLRSVYGTQARRQSRVIDGKSQQIGGKLQAFYGWLSLPFSDGNEQQKELQQFAKGFIAEIANKKGKANENRLKNLVQAIVRNPILRKDYGPNRSATAKNKGFDHLMIDTAQFFNSVRAKVVKHV